MQTSSATFLRETHGKRMDDIQNLLSDISLWYHEDESGDAPVKAKAFTEFGEKLRTGEYTIVVVGEFSAGKSTLLNALMGENLLPAYTNETTATVNFLRHIEQAHQGEKGCVYYNDETKQALESVDYNIIQQYVSTRGQNVVSNISHLDLYLDSEFLRDNVTLVDSPGLNGVAEGHADITNEQILESHACIFVFNATQPGSKSNFEFLTKLKSNVGTILFVLNRIDEINASEGDSPESVIAKIQESYQKFFPNSECPEIWPLAAKPALVARSNSSVEYRGKTEFNEDEKDALLQTSRIQGFETRLMEFLTKGEKTKRQSLEPITRVLEVGNRSKTEIETEIRLLEVADDTGEIEKNIIAVCDAIKSCETEMQSCYADVSSKVRAGFRDVTESIDADMNRYTDRTVSDINSFDKLEDINEYLKNVDEHYARYVKGLLEKYDANLRDSIIEQVFNNYHVFAERIQDGFAEIDVELTISVELNTREYTFNVGLAALEQQEEEIEEQLNQLRIQARQAEDKSLIAQGNMRAQNKLKDKLREMEEMRAEINNRSMPAVGYSNRTEERSKSLKEKGVLGVVGEFFCGEKMKRVEVSVVEDSAYKADAAKRDSDLQDLKNEMTKLTARLDDNVEIDLLTTHASYARVKAELDRLEEKEKELVKENREKFHNKYSAQLKRARNELRNFLGDKTEELIGEVKKTLRNQEKKYSGIVSSVIMANLKQALIEMQKKQENLRTRLNSSENERDERIAKLTDRLKRLEAILENAVSIKTELERLRIENVD